ncbi:MAG: aminotransferase class V-fold PLP-dependent enzyme, partial [Pseudomonadota bacterium]
MPQYNNPPLSSPLTGGQLAQRFDQLVAATQSGYSGASRPTDLQVGGVWSQVDATAVLYFLYDGTEDKLVKRVDLNTGATSTPESDALLALVTALTDRVDTLEAQAEQRKLPVGAVIKLTSGINPATALGYGVWQRIYNVFPVAAGGAYPLGSTGGRSSQAITAAHMPNHRHRVVSHAHGKGSLATIGLVPKVIESDWRAGANPEAIADALKADAGHEIKAVCVVHNETSTGCTSRIADVRRAIDDVGHPALLMVDTISGLASADFRMDEWGVDVTVSGSQKGLMLPPGLSFNAFSAKAREAHASAACPRSYWDWSDMLGPNANGYFPYTNATNMLYGLA